MWITEDLNWEQNTKEICRKAYSRMSMLTKLKYVGTNTEDLLAPQSVQSSHKRSSQTDHDVTGRQGGVSANHMAPALMTSS